MKFLSFFLLFIAIQANARTASEWLKLGDSLYAIRAIQSESDKARRDIINESNTAYRMAMRDPALRKMAGTKWLSGMYYQGCFAYTDESDRMRIFSEATQVGNDLYIKYPTDPQIGYWYLANLSLWAKEKGIWKAIRTGFADRVRQVSQTVMKAHQSESDSTMAGIYQILGRSHHLLPKIPFLLSWPDRNLAEKYLKLAVKLEPKNPSHQLFLAEFYRDQERWDESLQLVLQLRRTGIRESHALEDRRVLWKAIDVQTALQVTMEPNKVASIRQRGAY